MEAHRDLEAAWRSMTWSRAAGTFVLVGFPEPPDARDLDLLVPPAQLIREVEETTLLVREEHLPALLGRHPGARTEGDLAWIRFEAAMGWEVVGFLARVSAALAEAGVPIGAVCSYARDHLFIGRAHLERAEEVLATLFPRTPGSD